MLCFQLVKEFLKIRVFAAVWLWVQKYGTHGGLKWTFRQENSISKINSERSASNKKEELKNLVSSIDIVNKNSINEKQKLNFENFHLNKFIFFNEKLSKIFVRSNIKIDSKESDKNNNINDNSLKLPKIQIKWFI